MNEKTFDKIICFFYFFSVTLSLYYSGLSQIEGQVGATVPVPILLLPFVIVLFQLIRIVSLLGRVKINVLGRLWIFIFLYYLFIAIIDTSYGSIRYNYYVLWFVICPPVAWVYFSLLLKNKPSMVDLFIKWSFWILMIFVAICFYFIPQSIRQTGFFASLNTGYYVLFAYPLAMMDKNRVKQVVSTILMVLVILLSMKRGGMLSVALAGVMYYLFSSDKRIGRKIIAVSFIAITAIYLIPMINEYTDGSLENRYAFTVESGDEEGRVAIYQSVWDGIKVSSPFEVVFGHGHEAVSSDNIVNELSAHNDYLEFLYDYGLIGFILLLLYQSQLYKITKCAHKHKTDYWSTLFAFSSIIVLSLVSIVYAYRYFLVIIPFWCIMNSRLRNQ